MDFIEMLWPLLIVKKWQIIGLYAITWLLTQNLNVIFVLTDRHMYI